jgi:hypothetical protein
MRYFIRESILELIKTNPELFEKTIGHTPLFMISDNCDIGKDGPSYGGDKLIEIEPIKVKLDI